eukprot:3988897-Pyramimonas_sp.AAC.1
MEERFATMYCENHWWYSAVRCCASCPAFCAMLCTDTLFTKKWILSCVPESGTGKVPSLSACMSVSRLSDVAKDTTVPASTFADAVLRSGDAA